MEFDAGTLLDGQATLYNRITPKELDDEDETQDRWYVTKLSPVSWAETSERSVDSTGIVRYSRSLRLQIPAEAGSYLVPDEWVSAVVNDELDGQFTIRPGDFVLFDNWMNHRGKYVRASTIAQIKNTAGYVTGTVSQVRDLRNDAMRWRGEGFTASGVVGKYASILFALCT